MNLFFISYVIWVPSQNIAELSKAQVIHANNDDYQKKKYFF